MTSTFTALSHVGDLPCVYIMKVMRHMHLDCIPGSLSSIVMNAVLSETMSTAPGWSVEIIATLKYSDSSVVLSSMVDTIKMAYS